MPKKFLLRVNEDLWNEIERWAQDDLRSVNGQIEFLLREAVRVRRKKSMEGAEPGAGTDDDAS